MKKNLLLLTLLAILGINARASHSIGGEITYEWITSSMYKIKLTLTVDCNSTPPSAATITVASASCSTTQIKTLPLVSTRDVSQLCDTSSNYCNGGSFPGVTEWVFEGIVTSLSPCSDWVLSYDICCRNSSPANIVNPNSANFHIETTLDNTVYLNNKSPYFVDDPRWYIPVNQTSYINAGAYDANGDSLYFSMVAPKTAGGAPVSFMPGYSATEPFVSTPGTSINSQTGIITTTPTAIGSGLITVKVDEFRNGQFIGSVSRDFITNAINNSNTLPSITNATLNFNTCSVDTLNFDLFSTDPTDTITTSILYPFNPGTAPYFTNAGSPFNENTNYLNDTNNFYWDINVMSNHDYIVYVNVEDRQCPMINIQSYAIVVSTTNCGAGPCQVSISGSDTINACQSAAQLTAVANAGQGPFSFSWSPVTGLSNPNIPNPTANMVHHQQYIVTMTDSLGCQSYDSVIVNAYNWVADTFNVCSPDSVILDLGPGATYYDWLSYTDLFGNNTGLNDTTQTLTATQPGDYFAMASFPGCGLLTSMMTVTDTCTPCSVSIAQDTITACQTSAQLNAVPLSGQPGYTYFWSPATGLSNPNIPNPTVDHAHNQLYIVTQIDTLGCIAYDSVIVSAYNVVSDTFNICSPDSVVLDFGPGAYYYFWQFYTDTTGNTTSLTDTTQTITAYQPGDYAGYAYFQGCGALTSVITVEDTCGPPPCISFDVVNTPPSCPTCNDGTATIINLTGGCPPYTYSWNTVPPQIGNPATGLGSGTYQVTVTDVGSCCPPTTVTSCLSCDSVWPGDANSDMIADVYDILPIGVYYNTAGTTRPSASSNWFAQWSADWGINQSLGGDIKHADCEGDGLIDSNDVNPIILNYGLTHTKGDMNNSSEGINDPLLYVDMMLDTIPTSTPLAVPVKFGTSALPADSIYGLAFSITYDKNLVDSIAGVTVDYNGSWLGTKGTDMITIDTNFYDNGKIDIGLVRTDGQAMSGFGDLLTLNIITIDNLSGKTASYETLTFNFSNVVIIDNMEGLRLFNQQPDSIIIEDLNVGINQTKLVESTVQIIPNPNTGSFKVYIDDIDNSTIDIYNAVGQSVNFDASYQNGYVKINMDEFNKGIYFIKVNNPDKLTTVRKIIIQ